MLDTSFATIVQQMVVNLQLSEWEKMFILKISLNGVVLQPRHRPLLDWLWAGLVNFGLAFGNCLASPLIGLLI